MNIPLISTSTNAVFIVNSGSYLVFFVALPSRLRREGEPFYPDLDSERPGQQRLLEVFQQRQLWGRAFCSQERTKNLQVIERLEGEGGCQTAGSPTPPRIRESVGMATVTRPPPPAFWHTAKKRRDP
ncbi:hypothetical protein AVEN_50195-1 [Araneus ventricosus]|uniref:Uncharacterized protein n=1 Tax=Araneus ventricosus TaxID=182803 RepID=A0A4Y2WE03_ARAVE|nr:hypothetical protein AVEN_41408-1 [Araneus ventricosus]GBO34818.1 hypothetical protein AVEN_160259-1 [Araneus ventricosus]GBO36228.1 hypothetical protein AVEN_267108-1 [Araneus ventricosus]GBO36237.1 hypothetical protein AVEN_50195-1 [Araneus ventricosus]